MVGPEKFSQIFFGSLCKTGVGEKVMGASGLIARMGPIDGMGVAIPRVAIWDPLSAQNRAIVTGLQRL